MPSPCSRLRDHPDPPVQATALHRDILLRGGRGSRGGRGGGGGLPAGEEDRVIPALVC